VLVVVVHQVDAEEDEEVVAVLSYVVVAT